MDTKSRRLAAKASRDKIELKIDEGRGIPHKIKNTILELEQEAIQKKFYKKPRKERPAKEDLDIELKQEEKESWFMKNNAYEKQHKDLGSSSPIDLIVDNGDLYQTWFCPYCKKGGMFSIALSIGDICSIHDSQCEYGKLISYSKEIILRDKKFPVTETIGFCKKNIVAIGTNEQRLLVNIAYERFLEGLRNDVLLSLVDLTKNISGQFVWCRYNDKFFNINEKQSMSIVVTEEETRITSTENDFIVEMKWPIFNIKEQKNG